MRKPSPPQNSTTFIVVSSPVDRSPPLDRAHGRLPAQRRIEPTGGHMALDELDALEAVELFLGQAMASERVVHFFRAPANRPFGFEARERLPELAAVHFVATRIRSAAFHVLDRA